MSDSSNKYLFLQRDLDDLKDSIKDVEATIKEVESGVGASTSDSSETWHDNIMHEELMRKYKLWSHNRDVLRDLLMNAHLIDAPMSTDTVEIGSTVVVEEPEGGVSRYEIGSYHISKPSDGRISYGTPLATLLLGATRGEKRSGQIGPKLREFRILDIE